MVGWGLAFSHAPAGFGQTYSIDWFKFAGGGGSSTNGQFNLTGTIGQADASVTMVGGSFSLTGGFWSLLSTVQSPSAPTLSLSLSNGNAVLFWPLSSTRFTLQQNPAIGTTNWTDLTTSPETNSANLQVIVPLSPGNRFFRLRKL